MKIEEVNNVLESGENYLEAILQLEQKNGVVRSIDVAVELGVSKPSVSRAMGILRDNGYLTGETGNLVLTEKGRAKARAVLERHKIIMRFLVECLGVNDKTAAEDACKFEHDASEETFAHIKAWLARNN